MESKDSSSSSSPAFSDASSPASERFMEINVVKSNEFQGEEDDTYRAKTKPKGLVLFINNEHFECEKFEDRTGARVDEKNLVTLFSQLGLEVLIRRNLKNNEMRQELYK